MNKVKTLKSALALAVLLGTLSACSEPGYSRTSSSATSEPVRHTVGEQRNNNRQSQRRCSACGTVSEVNQVTQERRGTGVGAVLGAVVGGIAGRQVGGGTGRDVATVAGVIGGAVVGNKIEENRQNESYYEIVVDMESGEQRVFNLNYNSAVGIGVGSRVTVSGNNLSLR